MYGTFLLDCIIMKPKQPDLLERIIKTIDKPNDKRMQLFEQINGYYFERINYTLPQPPQDQKDIFSFGFGLQEPSLIQRNNPGLF
jgi:hypothetical protein